MHKYCYTRVISENMEDIFLEKGIEISVLEDVKKLKLRT